MYAAPTQPVTQVSLDPAFDVIRHWRADQEFCGAIGWFGRRSSKPLGYPSLLGCDLPYLQIVFRMDILEGGVSVELSFLAPGHRLDSSRWRFETAPSTTRIWHENSQ
jgi:hypothetical protein